METKAEQNRWSRVPRQQQMTCDKCGERCTINKYGRCKACRNNKICSRCATPFESAAKNMNLYENRHCKACRRLPRPAR